MDITSDYNQARMLKELMANQEMSYASYLSELIEMATEFVEEAKMQPEGHDLGFYNDRTGDLRASIGAYIFRDGVLVWSIVEGNADENMRLVLEDDGKIANKGFTVVGIAGKYYASYVESKGYNVVSTQWDSLTVVFDILKKL